MSDIISSFALRLFTCGAVCTVCLLFSKGPLKECVRLCAACVIIAAIFSGKSFEISELDYNIAKTDMENIISEEIHAAQSSENALAEKEMENALLPILSEKGVSKKIKLCYDGALTVFVEGAYDEKTESIIKSVCGTEKIIFEGNE